MAGIARILPVACCMLVGVMGCGSATIGSSMDHIVDVPLEYRQGRGMSNFPSCHETYLEAYEQGWWQCIKNYAADIDYASTERDTWAVKYGGQITWRAYAKGHVDAEARIKENIRLFGKENMQQELQWLLDPT